MTQGGIPTLPSILYRRATPEEFEHLNDHARIMWTEDRMACTLNFRVRSKWSDGVEFEREFTIRDCRTREEIAAHSVGCALKAFRQHFRNAMTKPVQPELYEWI